MYDSRIFNVLMAGTRAGTVQLFVFGMLASGQINVRQLIGVLPNQPLDINDVRMSPDFSMVYVWIRYEGRCRQLSFRNPLYGNPETIVSLLKLATRYGYIVNTLTYIDEIVLCIIEAWETAKLEMERKLTKYVNARPPGVVSADFLDLLMLGYSPEPLTEFLIRDLTSKGMKRLEHSIEITYATIQKLVVRPLHTAILNISFHLNYLKGMSKNAYFYKVSHSWTYQLDTIYGYFWHNLAIWNKFWLFMAISIFFGILDIRPAVLAIFDIYLAKFENFQLFLTIFGEFLTNFDFWHFVFKYSRHMHRISSVKSQTRPV